ncbi:MAG: hypothetical protein GX639_05535 [Fibrobacter sp.]|nr:hypothetical protein [Fibrobacter sp.]
MGVVRLISVYGVLLSGVLVFGDNGNSFTDAVNKLVQKNPLISAIDSEIKGLDTLHSKSKQYLDPTVSTSVDCSGLNEFGLGIEQTFERSIKQRTRKELYEKKIDLKKTEKIRQEHVLHIEASRRYLPVLFGLQKVNIVDSMITESFILDTMIQRYVDAGAILHTDALKAKLDIEKYRMQRFDLMMDAERARAHFCSMSPSDSLLLMSVEASINESFVLPDIKQIAINLEKSFGYEIVNAESAIIDTEKKLVKAEAKKDLTLGLEYSRNRTERENTLTAEVSIDLPLFRNVDREQADLEHQKSALLFRYKSEITATLGEIRDIYRQISMLEQKNRMISDTIIPSLIKQYDTYMSIYKEGKGSFRDVSEIRMELHGYKMEVLDNEMSIMILAIDVAEKSGIKPEVLK